MVIKDAFRFEQNLYNLINSCGLPVDTAYYILKSVYLDFQKTVYEYAEKDGDNYTVEEKIYTLDDEEKENNYEQSINADASADSGSINDN